jgi:hypothetical protein
MMRQIAGSFSQYEKAHLVSKLRSVRERIRKVQGNCEGRKSLCNTLQLEPVASAFAGTATSKASNPLWARDAKASWPEG